jgi:hypothetical protein
LEASSAAAAFIASDVSQARSAEISKDTIVESARAGVACMSTAAYEHGGMSPRNKVQ